jgi:hypothetical protein
MQYGLFGRMTEAKAVITSQIGAGTDAVGAESLRVHAEDVMDMVFDKSAHLTPFVSYCPKGKAKAKTVEWIVDKLVPVTDPQDSNRAEAGANSDWTRTGLPSHQKRVRLDSMTQNIREDLEVHDVNEALDAFGVADEYNYQAQKKMKEMAILLEKQCFLDTFVPVANTGYTGTVPTTWVDPTRMKPLTQLVIHGSEATALNFTPNLVNAQDMTFLQITAGAPVEDQVMDPAGNPPTANTRIDEDMITKAFELLIGNADDAMIQPDTVWLSTAPYGHVGAFGSVSSPSGNLGALEIQKDMRLNRIARVVKVYGTQFGDVAFVHTRWIQQAQNTGTATTFVRGATPVDHPLFDAAAGTGNYGNAWITDRSMLSLDFLRPVVHKPLPKQGDSTIGMIVGDVALKLKHPQAAMLLTAINNV